MDESTKSRTLNLLRTQGARLVSHFPIEKGTYSHKNSSSDGATIKYKLFDQEQGIALLNTFQVGKLDTATYMISTKPQRPTIEKQAMALLSAKPPEKEGMISFIKKQVEKVEKVLPCHCIMLMMAKQTHMHTAECHSIM